MANTLTGNTPQQERDIQERLMNEIADAMEPRFRREIARAMTEYATSDNEGKVTDAHQDKVEALLRREYRETWMLFGQRELDAALKHWAGRIETKVAPTEVFDRAMQQWIDKYASQQVTAISNTTKEQADRVINRALAEAVGDGLSERETGRLIRTRIRQEGGKLSAFRGEMIARTEAHSAAGSSTQAAAEATGLPMAKEWSSAFATERSRQDHLDMDGAQVSLNESFIMPSGEALMYPGDPNGSAAEIINCRCVAVHVVAD